MSYKNLDLITKELRLLDYNAYLCATLCHKDDFYKVASILLLQAELTKIADITQEEMVGMIRLAWWKENLQDIFEKNKSAKHHLLEALLKFKDVIDYHLLMQVFEGFEKDFIEEATLYTKAQLEDYIFKTREIFMQIILKIVKHEDASLAKNIADISFYFDVLKRIQQEDEKVTKFFYSDFFEELGISAQSWKKNEDEDNLRMIVQHLVEKINSAAKTIETKQNSLNKNLKHIILRKDLVQLLLQDLPKKNFDIFAVNLSANRFVIKMRFLRKIW